MTALRLAATVRLIRQHLGAVFLLLYAMGSIVQGFFYTPWLGQEPSSLPAGLDKISTGIGLSITVWGIVWLLAGVIAAAASFWRRALIPASVLMLGIYLFWVAAYVWGGFTEAGRTWLNAKTYALLLVGLLAVLLLRWREARR